MQAIGYYRLSKTELKKNPLGLDAQRDKVRAFCHHNGITLVHECREVGSGKGDGASRPVLIDALTRARKSGAAVIVADIDRLSRDVHYGSGVLADNKINFIEVSSGLNADRFMLHLKLAFAENERRKISERTKAALNQLKQRGHKLGNQTNLAEARAKGHATNQQKGMDFAQRVKPIIQPLLNEGLSYRAIAKRLNDTGVKTARGGQWAATQVSAIAKRLEEIESNEQTND